ncbi:dolichyl-phosphate mannose protein mannosyltransferase [Nosema bombycis CQ1]|uniref:Dolichyl-phosphate mannose protein mannosyltransferase n=1 Tax=Nosema bombycis (strain CQ1 / CVCC 102059) TaxID=578461 RepID=R0KVF3_NOSB1|nr:dolichyl-phosphate mannose protein mannosyltransferase [Nosema bombycis CQ1]|eukprot:EOB14197.1 dolichyl-phosphate mannose protein mannosyltransferase [Nosema bombycis CQ1]
MNNSHDFLFVIGFALIPLLKKSLTTRENTYLQVLHSYLERKFKFDNSLPMPYLLDYCFYKLMTYLDYKDGLKLIILQGIRIVYHILLVYFIYKILGHKQNEKTSKAGLNLLSKSLLPIIFCKSITQLSGKLNNTSSLFYSVLSIYLYLKRNLIVSSLFLGLAITTNWASLGVLFILLGCIGFEFYDDVIDKNKKVIRTCLNTLRKTFIMSSIPFMIYFISFILSYEVRYQYDPSISKFSLEFQSTFYNKDLEKCHKTLVNNSIVTFINKRYKWYLSAEKKENDFSVFGSKTLDENCLWIIKKASGDKGFILPGEKVRIIHFSYEKALSLNKVDSKEKFFSLELTDEELVKESENELFRFEIVKNFTNLIEARNTFLNW